MIAGNPTHRDIAGYSGFRNRKEYKAPFFLDAPPFSGTIEVLMVGLTALVIAAGVATVVAVVSPAIASACDQKPC